MNSIQKKSARASPTPEILMNRPLTARQLQVLECIQAFVDTTGMPPTRAEIARQLGFRSANAAEEHLRALARKGAIELRSGASRGIRLLAPSGVPVIGEVAAGNPILATEHIEDHYPLPPRLFRPRAHYLLRVRGMSMRDAGILNRDLLAVHRAREATNKQIVVARLEDEVTVKEFRRRGNIVTLLPRNPDFDPVRIDLRQQSLAIEGIGVGVIRNDPLP
jgi:repressor LexA|tara:strand:+ start:16804 stop:17463 length:660 start_codon:yes stop_codon:yes gene_type:complete